MDAEVGVEEARVSDWFSCNRENKPADASCFMEMFIVLFRASPKNPLRQKMCLFNGGYRAISICGMQGV